MINSKNARSTDVKSYQNLGNTGSWHSSCFIIFQIFACCIIPLLIPTLTLKETKEDEHKW